MPSKRTAEQLRAIIRTQTKIAASDLDPEAIMPPRSKAAADRELREAKDRLYGRAFK